MTNNNKIVFLIQDAIGGFRENPYWRGLYDNAPGQAKRYYALTFALSDAAPFGEEVLESISDLLDEEVDCLYCEMTDEEWDYVLSNAEGPSRIGLGYARKMMQGMPKGTRAGYWNKEKESLT